MSRRKRKRTQRRTWISIVVAWVIFLTGGYALLGGNVISHFGGYLPFNVQKLKILGAEVMQVGEVLELVSVREGDPLFGRWYRDALSRLSSHPRVESVAIVRNATGEVLVRLIERQSQALIAFEELYGVDVNGRVLGIGGPGTIDARILPVITGAWTGNPNDGQFDPEIAEGLQLLNSLRRTGIPDRVISEIHLDEERGWIMYRSRSGSRIVFGRNRFATKTKRLARVLHDFDRKENLLQEIDLDFETRAVVKVKEVI